MTRSVRASLAFTVLALAGGIAGCSRVTADNYAKLKVGMSYQETTDILGPPTGCDEAAGFKSCRWGDDKSNITVRFAADKAVLHSAENVR
jgi:outer membrane protein assembly factor BamE (lipoprotein component of BamABCDE complex)